METLTKNEVRQISVVRYLDKFLEACGKDRHMQKESRILRLEMELEHLNGSGPRSNSVLHPSSLHLGGDEPEMCQRKIAYARKYEKSPYSAADPKSLRIFETGHDAHGKYQGWLAYIFRDDFQAEVPISIEKYNISGNCDGKLMYPLDDGRKVTVVLEFKTIKQEKWEKLRGPMDKHVDQALIYMAALDAPVACFLYENKNTQEMKEYLVSFESVRDRWDRIERRVQNLIQHLDQGTLPPRTIGWFGCKDGTCPFWKQCRPTEQRGVGITKLAELTKRRKKDGPSRITRHPALAGSDS